MITDADLKAMSIPTRNLVLDQIAHEQELCEWEEGQRIKEWYDTNRF